MVLRDDRFRFRQRGESPLDLEILDSGDGAPFFDKQSKVTGLIGVGRVEVEVHGKIAPGRNPVALDDALLRVPTCPRSRTGDVRQHVTHPFFWWFDCRCAPQTKLSPKA